MPFDARAPAGSRGGSRRERIVDAALRALAGRGYRRAKVEDVAAEAGTPQGSVFQHVGSKAGLFFAAYHRAVASLPRWLDAPDDVTAAGSGRCPSGRRTEHLTDDDRVPIDRVLVTEDPSGRREFIEFGIERGDLRPDHDVEMAASMLEWLTAGFQDALVTKGSDATDAPVDRHGRAGSAIAQLVDPLQRALGAGPRARRRSRPASIVAWPRPRRPS